MTLYNISVIYSGLVILCWLEDILTHVKSWSWLAYVVQQSQTEVCISLSISTHSFNDQIKFKVYIEHVS